jgi:hypothetical protein
VNAIVEATYPSRIEAVKALRTALASGEQLRAVAGEAAEQAKAFGRVPGARDWQALAAGLEIAAFLTDWASAVTAAETDADRFLRAARQRLKQLDRTEEPSNYHRAVVECLSSADEDLDPDAVASLRTALGSIPMPMSILADPEPPPRPDLGQESAPQPDDLAVAFLEFTINGEAAENLHALRPNEVHDLGLTIRVSRWPAGADRLSITPVSIEPSSVWDLPRFTISRPDGTPPYTFQRDGRMVIHAPQGFDARPLEFLYAAEFQPAAGDERIVVAGQRRLRLDGIDAGSRAVTGYGGLDRRILEIRGELRRLPTIPEDDIRSVLAVLTPLANLIGSAVQDALYPSPILEADFERDVRQRLRNVPAIGADLEQQAQAAGGRTDLSFRGIRIELKSERKKRLLPADCATYADQAASYAVGSGKRVAILCILDCSPKSTPPLPIESCLFMQPRDSGGGAVHVITALVQGGLPRPGDLSR